MVERKPYKIGQFTRSAKKNRNPDASDALEIICLAINRAWRCSQNNDSRDCVCWQLTFQKAGPSRRIYDLHKFIGLKNIKYLKRINENEEIFDYFTARHAKDIIKKKLMRMFVISSVFVWRTNQIMKQLLYWNKNQINKM